MGEMGEQPERKEEEEGRVEIIHSFICWMTYKNRKVKSRKGITGGEKIAGFRQKRREISQISK